MRDIKIIINDDGYASSYEKFIGIQNENEATRLVFDLPDIYKKDGSYQYVAFNLPDGTIKVRSLVDYACIIDSEITSQRGVILISVIIKSVENVLDIETGFIMSSQPISGYIKKTILEETGTNSIDKNVRIYLDEFDALLMEIRKSSGDIRDLTTNYTSTINDLLNEYNTKIDRLYNELNRKIANITDNASDMAEVIDARGKFTNLGLRLDKKPYYFDNVAIMKSDKLKEGDYAITSGYYSINDGGGATYKIRNKKSDDVEDNGSIHFIGTNLVAELIFNTYVTPEQFGAYGDGTSDDTEYIRKVLESKYNVIFKSNKVYRINLITVENISNKIIKGNNATIKYLNGWLSENDTSKAIIIFKNCNNIEIENLTFNANQNWINNTLTYTSRPLNSESNYHLFINNLYKTISGIKLNECNNIIIENCIATKSSKGFVVTNSVNVKINNCKSIDTWADGVFIVGTSRYVYVNNHYFEMVNDDQCSALGFNTDGVSNSSYVYFNNCHSHNCWGALVCFEGASHVYANNCSSDNCNYAPLKGGAQAVDGNYIHGTDQHYHNISIKMSNRVQHYSNTLNMITGVNGNNANVYYDNVKIDGTDMDNNLIMRWSYGNFNFNNIKFIKCNPYFPQGIFNLVIKNSSIQLAKERIIIQNATALEISNNFISSDTYTGNPIAISETNSKVVLRNNTILNQNGISHVYVVGNITNLITDDNNISISDLDNIRLINPCGVIFRVPGQFKSKFPSGEIIYNTNTNLIEIIP